MARPLPVLKSIPAVDTKVAPEPPPRAYISSRCSRAQDCRETRAMLQQRRKQRQKQRNELSYSQGNVQESNQQDRVEQSYNATVETAARMDVVDDIVTSSDGNDDELSKDCRNNAVQSCVHGMPKASSHLVSRQAVAFLDHVDRCHKTVNPGQCLLMCFREGPASHCAIPINCLWPDDYAHESPSELYINNEPVTTSTCSPPVTVRETARECNSDVLQRILDGTYRSVGKWKRHVPFYGIVHVQLVLLEFHGAAYKNGRRPVHIYDRGVFQIQEVLDQEEQDRRRYEEISTDDEWDGCNSGCGCTDRCYDMQQFASLKCAAEEALDANKRIKAWKIFEHVLKSSCKPLHANGEDITGALKSVGCLHNLYGISRLELPQHGESYDCTGEYRAIQVTFGWQYDRMKNDRGFQVFATIAAVAIIWICTASWISNTGNKATAMTFGSLVAACMTLVWMQVQTFKNEK